MKKLFFLAQVILLVTILYSPAAAVIVPERLVYDVSWSGIKAGSAVLEVTAQGDEYRIVNTIQSTGFASAFFRIDNKTESLISRNGRPRFFRKDVNEGKFQALREATFDFTTLRADSRDLRNKTQKSDPISARTYDNISSIYFIRSSELAPGQSISFDIYDTKRLWNAEVAVVRREEIATELGTFKTVMVTSQLKSNGVLARVGNATFWFTDDKRRIPVRITTTLKVGEITLTLVGPKDLLLGVSKAP